MNKIAILFLGVLAIACQNGANNKGETTANEANNQDSTSRVKPLVVTEKVNHDTDDPAIWVHPGDVRKSLIIGTDKDINGALFAFDLDGKIAGKTMELKRPNNVDVGYRMDILGNSVDYAITGERFTHNIRIFSLPDMKSIDGGGIPAFEGETGEEFRDIMGIAVYMAPDGTHYAIVGRKNGPQDGTYLWQYRLYGKEDGTVGGELVRKFGQYSGVKEIEAIAVDHKLGYIYYSDEQVGVRKYHADPKMGNEEIAFFAKEGYLDDNEGISIYQHDDSTGYIIVSDQARNAFRIYPREGADGNPHHHPELGAIDVSTNNSDGNEITTETFGGRFPGGLFVAMSDDKTFQYYSWKDMAGNKFRVKE